MGGKELLEWVVKSCGIFILLIQRLNTFWTAINEGDIMH